MYVIGGRLLVHCTEGNCSLEVPLSEVYLYRDTYFTVRYIFVCYILYSANTTIQGQYLISQSDAAAVVSATPPSAPDTPIDPIGIYIYIMLFIN